MNQFLPDSGILKGIDQAARPAISQTEEAQSPPLEKSVPKMDHPTEPQAPINTSLAPRPPSPAPSQAAAQAIKALQEKNYRLECNSQVLENLLKEYKQRCQGVEDDKKQIDQLKT